MSTPNVWRCVIAACLLFWAMVITGCAQLIGPAGWVAQNQVPLQNLLLLSATVVTTQQAVTQTMQLLDPTNGTVDSTTQK